MKTENYSNWRAGSILKIIERLGNRLGRETPGRLVIKECCQKGAKCSHSDYPMTSWDLTRSKLSPLYFWFPQNGEFSSRDVAYILDRIMSGQTAFKPPNLQERVRVVRGFQWAEKFPLERKLARVLPPRPQPTRQDKLRKRKRQAERLLTQWRTKQKLASTKVSKYEAEVRRLDRSIEKEGR